MNIKCGNCGKDIVVPDGLVAGQHVRCPYCNEKTAFDKPSRIELPEGFEVKRRARTRIDELKREHAEKSSESMPNAQNVTGGRTKPKLGIIRPAAQVAVPDLNAEAIKRRMEEEEEEKRVAGEKAAAAWSSVRREKIFRQAVVFGVLAILTAVGICWFVSSSRERMRKRLEALQRHEQLTREEDRRRQVRQDEQDRERAEQEAKRNAVREVARKEAEQRKMARAARARDEAQKDAERQRHVEAYKSVAQSFRVGKLRMADHGKILGALNAREDAFYFCLAKEGDGLSLYEVASASNGVRRVVKMVEDGTVSAEDLAVFTNKLDRSDYLMAHGQQVCYRSLRAKPMSGRLNLTECANPTETFFGNLYGSVTTLGLSYDELKFDVVFLPAASGRERREIAVATVGFGGEVMPCQVRNAVIEAFPMTEKEGRLSVKKYRRTIMYWNGNIVKKGADGITYVPRCLTTTDAQAWNRWRALKDQVEAEDIAEQNYYSEAQAALDQKMAKANESLREKWRAQIRDTLKNGTLGFRAKISKGELP